MFAIYGVMAVAALIAFVATYRLHLSRRMMIAAIVFLVPSLAMTALVIAIGDPIPPDTVNVDFSGNDCELLMTTFESNTADNTALARLEAECPGWESMR